MLEVKMGPEESSLSIISAGAVLGPCAPTHAPLRLRAPAPVLQMNPAVSSHRLQMIQSATNTEELHPEAFMKNGLFFRAMKHRPEHTQLLVWYGGDLAKLLDLSSEQKSTKGLMCSECKQTFLSEFPLSAHKRFFCIKKPLSFLKKNTISEIKSCKPATNFHNLARELESCRRRAQSPKRRRSLESDTDESDGGEQVFVKRFCVNGVNRSEGRDSSRSQTQSRGNVTADPDERDLTSSAVLTESAISNENKTSAFTLPPPRIPLTSASRTNLFTPQTPALPPAVLSSALLNKDPPRRLAPRVTLWPRTAHLLTPSLSAQNWCAKCNVSFHMTSDLVQHMRSHHKRALSAEREPRHRDDRLKCPVCEETFRERHHLSRHMTSHT